MKKHLTFGNIIFAIFILLLIIPQTRTPIQVAINKLKVWVWSPSELDQEDQTQLAPFTYKLADLNSTPKTVEIGKGTVTFISYWATWCPPCIAELPSIEKLYTAYGEEMNFILITDEETEMVKCFMEKKGCNLPVYNPGMEAPKMLSSSSIPTNYIIDGSGKIIIKETGAADWDGEKVRGVLEGLLSQ